MKTKTEILEIIQNHKPELIEKYHIDKIGIFGSYSRDEQMENSDVDVLVSFSEPIGWEYFDLIDYLERLLQKKVDLTTEKALKPLIKDEILQELIYT